MQAVLCQFIQRYLRFARKWLFNKTCKRQNFMDKSGVTYAEVVSQVESAISQTQRLQSAIKTEYVDMGGANNLGMLLHWLPQNKMPSYTTKLEACSLSQRELHFFTWQQQHLQASQNIAPNLICCEPVGDLGICALTMDYLSEPRTYEPEALIDLYRRMGALNAKAHEKTTQKPTGNLFFFDLEAKTKITRTLRFIVTQLHCEEGYQQALNFLEIRQSAFAKHPKEFAEIYRFIEQSSYLVKSFDENLHYGFVHGDFKKANILSDYQGNLKAIDLQYYCYGARLWDLAFFCSKEKTFSEAYSRFVLPMNLSETETRMFVMLFMLASLLHVKKKNVVKILKKQLLPAMMLVESKD